MSNPPGGSDSSRLVDLRLNALERYQPEIYAYLLDTLERFCLEWIPKSEHELLGLKSEKPGDRAEGIRLTDW